MAASTPTVAVSCVLLAILVMCQPVNAQQQKVGASGAAMASVLATIDVDKITVDSMLKPLKGVPDFEVHKLMVPPANPAAEPISTPSQAVSTVSKMFDSEVQDAVRKLILLPRSSSGGRGGGNQQPVQIAGTPFSFGYARPMPFTAGQGLPPVAQATPQQLMQFAQQLQGDMQNQWQSANAALAYQRTAAGRKQYDKIASKACVQYGLSQFMRLFSQLLLSINQASGDVLGVVSQFVGIDFSGLSQQGDEYLQTYCCGVVKQSGINIQLGNGTFTVAGVIVDATDMLSGNRSRQARPPPSPPRPSRARAPPPQCNPVEWIAYALQENKFLQQQFLKLFKAGLKLKDRVLSTALTAANVAGNVAATGAELIARQTVVQINPAQQQQQQMPNDLAALLARG